MGCEQHPPDRPPSCHREACSRGRTAQAPGSPGLDLDLFLPAGGFLVVVQPISTQG